MATNTHTTATVKLSLDLGEIITQLRDLADTLEATQTPKTDPEPDKPTDCERCDTNEWEAWNRSQWHVPGSRAGRGARQPKPAELDECRHEAWDVHPNGITRRCSDCRAPLPDLEPGTCHCGAKPNEVHNPLFAHPERVTVSEVYINPNPNGFTPEAVEALVDAEMRRARHRLPDGDFPCCAPEPASAPEPANYTDGTQPYRNPHTLDLPEGIDPAEAQHILRLADDALKARTQPIVFAAGDTSKPRAFVATRITPDHPALNLGVDSDGLRCTRCEHPYHRRGICPTCGCDH